MNKKTLKKNIMPYIVLLLVIFGIMYFMDRANNKINILEYSEFYNKINSGEVTEITMTPKSSAGVYEITGKLKDYGKNETFFIRVPLSDTVISLILSEQTNNSFKITTEKDPESNGIMLFLINVVPLMILVIVAFIFINKQMSAGNKSMDFGKSKARLNEQNNKVTFENVAGLDEEKEEVAELIDFLKMPKKFQR